MLRLDEATEEQNKMKQCKEISSEFVNWFYRTQNNWKIQINYKRWKGDVKNCIGISVSKLKSL